MATLRDNLPIFAQPCAEAVVAGGSRLPRILWMHSLPDLMVPLIEQAAYVRASAIVIEATLSLLGARTSREVPIRGILMAEGQVYVQVAPLMVLSPSVFMAVAAFAVNILGDGLRDSLDSRIARRM